jgi:hypothetical protein
MFINSCDDMRDGVGVNLGKYLNLLGGEHRVWDCCHCD